MSKKSENTKKITVINVYKSNNDKEKKDNYNKVINEIINKKVNYFS